MSVFKPQSLYKSHENNNLHDAHIKGCWLGQDSLSIEVGTFTIKDENNVVYMINPCTLVFHEINSILFFDLQKNISLEIEEGKLIDLEFGGDQLSKLLPSGEVEFSYYLAENLSASFENYQDYTLKIICMGFTLRFDKENVTQF